MKKGLLLSVVASGLIYAGGDIAPVAPVQQPTVAPAACDFWGSLGLRYDMNQIKVNGTTIQNGDFGDKESNTFFLALDLGVEKQLGYGFGLGAEVAAFRTSHDIALNPSFTERAELSQLYLTYKVGNTAFKFGRQALPKSLSPWAWTDTTLGTKDLTFEGLVVVNTDLPDTTLVGAWVSRAVNGATRLKVNGKDNKGLFAIAAQYTGIANTTLRGSAYFVTKDPAGNTKYSIWASAETKVSNVNLGLQAAYAKTKGSKATTGVAAYAGTTYGALDGKLTVAYIKNGATSLVGAGSGFGTSGFWGNVGYAPVSMGGDITTDNNGAPETSAKQTIVKLDLGYKLPNNYGRIFGGVAYDKVTGTSVWDKGLAARVGYSFKVKGVNAKVEYRYEKLDAANGNDLKINRVRVEGIYKF